jgi:hypothetical protein
VMNVNEGHCDHCLHRTSKSGKVTYFHNVLEAKCNFSISSGRNVNNRVVFDDIPST